MNIVALAGDWHGNLPWARARIAAVAARGVGRPTPIVPSPFASAPRGGRHAVDAVAAERGSEPARDLAAHWCCRHHAIRTVHPT
ncbi:MAG: hypothetical protein ACRDPK_11905 [Carbonactinosporaceae bacterium]